MHAQPPASPACVSSPPTRPISPFQGGEFALVYTNKTTHHIRDWPRALAEMARVLKPGGRLLYADFVAPFGHRFPTRRGVETATAAHGLQCESRGGSPFHYSAVFQAADPAPPARASPSSGKTSE